MKFLRSFFRLRFVYFKYTAEHLLYLCAATVIIPAVFVILWSTLFGDSGTTQWVAVALFLILFCMWLREIVRNFLVNRILNNLPLSPMALPSGDTKNLSISAELDSIDGILPVAAYDNAKLFVASFNHYRRTKNGQYLNSKTYYRVLEMPLRRRLPHILFDSKQAKGRQFKHLYLKVQRISVQGTFDLVFDTYAPRTYHIDSLSFVSPEVMEVLVDAKDYDIEIIEDKVYLYAPLLGEEATEIFVAKGQAIARHLNDNIDTYHDNRLTGDDRKATVTPFAYTLLKSPRKYQMIAGLALCVIGGILVGAIIAPGEYRLGILFNGYSLFVYLVFLINTWSAQKIKRDNKNAMERFRILHHTDRGRPLKKTVIADL